VDDFTLLAVHIRVHTTEAPSRGEEARLPQPLSTAAGGALPALDAYTSLQSVPFHPSRLFLPIPEGRTVSGVAPLAAVERRVGCSVNSSCGSLSPLDPASGVIHCCELPCCTLRSVEGVTTRPSRVCVSVWSAPCSWDPSCERPVCHCGCVGSSPCTVVTLRRVRAGGDVRRGFKCVPQFPRTGRIPLRCLPSCPCCGLLRA
jgi:hypothetical protein